MKFILALAVLSTVSAYACPDLSGHYAACRSTDGSTGGSSDMVVEQSIQNGVTVYSVTSTDAETHERTTDKVTADGRGYTTTQSIPNTSEVLVVTMTASCSSDALVIKEIIAAQGQTLANATVTITKSGNTITTTTVGSGMGQTINTTEICQ